MIGRNVLARVASRAVDSARTTVALRQASRVGAGVRVFGWPRIAADGDLAIAKGAVLVSSPAPIHLVVSHEAVLSIGEGAVLESGVTVRATVRIVVEAGARIGAGCILDDQGSSEGITVGAHAWIEDGAVLLAGTHVAPSAVVRAGTVVATALHASALPESSHAKTPEYAGSDLDERIRGVVVKIAPAVGAVPSAHDLSGVRGWDSLCALRVVVALEKEFGVVLPHDLLATKPRIDLLVTAVATARAQAPQR